MGLFDWINGKPKSAKETPAAPPSPSQPTGPIDQKHKPIEHKPSDALAKLAKPGWLLHMQSGEDAPRASRVGGRPFMAENETWPSCGHCKNPLSFMFQYDLEALTDEGADAGTGLLRLFYCEADDCVGMGGWEAFDEMHHLSITTAHGDVRDVPENTKIHPASYVTRWEKVEDVPHWEDRPAELRDDEAGPYPGHKFGGWAHWIQGPERPNCPECQSEMQTILQLDEDHTRSFNFGGGIGHITQCRTHPNTLAFGWACG